MRALLNIVIPIVALGMAAPVRAQVPPPKPSAPRPAAAARAAAQDVAALQELLTIYANALAAKNATALAMLYATDAPAPDFDLALTLTSPKDPRSLGDVGALRVTLDGPPQVNRRGTVAWTTATFSAAGTFEGRSIQIPLRHTAVWERRGQEWRLLHDHVSAPWSPPVPPQPTAPAPEDEPLIRQLFTTYAEAWNAGDASRLSALWDDEGDAGSLSSGTVVTGREGISAMWTGAMSRRAPGASTEVQAVVQGVRFLGPTTAMVDGMLRYAVPASGKQKASVSEERFVATVRKEDDRWGIGSIRTVNLPPPAPEPPPARRR